MKWWESVGVKWWRSIGVKWWCEVRGMCVKWGYGCEVVGEYGCKRDGKGLGHVPVEKGAQGMRGHFFVWFYFQEVIASPH